MPRRESGPPPSPPPDQPDPLMQTRTVLRPKWTPQIVCALLDGPMRYTALQQALGAITPHALIARLRALEAYGLVTRTYYPEIPPRVEYALSEEGRTLRPLLEAMAALGGR